VSHAGRVLIPLALLLARPSLADTPVASTHGGWVASAGAAVFRGRWSADALPGRPDEVQGSWTLLGAGEAIVLEGTWAARRSGPGWKGQWSARTATGGFFTGTWKAEGVGRGPKTFADLLASASSQRISGTWRMRGATGRWWLEGTR
jgi:hypothetical protein